MYEFATAVKLAALVLGAPSVLAVWWFRTRRLPDALPYIAISVVACTLIFATAFVAADAILERRFMDLIPDGVWTASDEAAWNPEERRLVRAYFGDGGRNVFALFTPLVFGVYSAAVWTAARAAGFVISRRRTA